MTTDDGGEDATALEVVDGLAPVIPLFGSTHGVSGFTRGAPITAGLPNREPPWHTSWVGRDEPDGSERRLSSDVEADARSRGLTSVAQDDVDPDSIRDAAENTLLRRLRTRSLSMSEARSVIDGAGMTADAAEELLSRFARLGYLDDVALAEQLMRAAVERKGQGRQAISPLLARRGIPREVIDAVLAGLPDDDLERALEFARVKARSLGARDRETALRRLLGQLARRGYPSSVSLAAARQALDEL